MQAMLQTSANKKVLKHLKDTLSVLSKEVENGDSFFPGALTMVSIFLKQLYQSQKFQYRDDTSLVFEEILYS